MSCSVGLFPLSPKPQGHVNYFVLPDGQCCVVSYKIFKTGPSWAKYFMSADNTIDSNFTNQWLPVSQKSHIGGIAMSWKYSCWVHLEVKRTKSTRWIALYMCELQRQQFFLACLFAQGFNIKSVFDENCVTHLARVLKAKSRLKWKLSDSHGLKQPWFHSFNQTPHPLREIFL